MQICFLVISKLRQEENGYGGTLTMFVFHLNHMQQNPHTPGILGGWRIVWEVSSFHLLCVLCHRNLFISMTKIWSPSPLMLPSF